MLSVGTIVGGAFRLIKDNPVAILAPAPYYGYAPAYGLMTFGVGFAAGAATAYACNWGYGYGYGYRSHYYKPYYGGGYYRSYYYKPYYYGGYYKPYYYGGGYGY